MGRSTSTAASASLVSLLVLCCSLPPPRGVASFAPQPLPGLKNAIPASSSSPASRPWPAFVVDRTAVVARADLSSVEGIARDDGIVDGQQQQEGELMRKTVIVLRAELKSRGLPVSGTKAKLVRRLMGSGADVDWTSPTGDGASMSPPDEKNGKQAGEESSSMADLIPRPLLDTLTRRIFNRGEGGDDDANQPGQIRFLPVQERAYRPILAGSDSVLVAPTGSGKTLGYVLPLFARLLEWKKSGDLKKGRGGGGGQGGQRGRRLTQKEYFADRSARKNEPATPCILIAAPSRELARQIGKVCSQYHPTSSGRVATVFGGVPLERHASLLRGEVDVIVGTPGRIRELIREDKLSTSEVRTVVLDEADVLLNFDDQPEIEMLLDGMTDDYQLVLVSATVNDGVRNFVEEVMEIDVGGSSDDGYVVVGDGGESDDGSSEKDRDDARGAVKRPYEANRPTVRHWYTPARASARCGVTSDLISTLRPRLAIVFVASKAEADSVSDELSDGLASSRGTRVSVLHGDMSQSARSRTVASLRRNNGGNDATTTRILVATDVASRGLDLPGVDLIVQLGVPRRSGKEGTYDTDLYVHRTGRAGRVGGGGGGSSGGTAAGGRDVADVVLLYDPVGGEGRVLPELRKDLESVGTKLEPRPLPSPSEVMEASYRRVVDSLTEVSARMDSECDRFFRDKIEMELGHIADASTREEVLTERLAAAMAALSGLGGVAPGRRSLLTADPRDRTLRVWWSSSDGHADAEEGGGDGGDDGDAPLSPTEVTRFVKGLGSGKLGRVTVCGDGSAVFDLPERRALVVLENAAAAHAQRDRNGDSFSRSLQVEIAAALPC